MTAQPVKLGPVMVVTEEYVEVCRAVREALGFDSPQTRGGGVAATPCSAAKDPHDGDFQRPRGTCTPARPRGA